MANKLYTISHVLCVCKLSLPACISVVILTTLPKTLPSPHRLHPVTSNPVSYKQIIMDWALCDMFICLPAVCVWVGVCLQHCVCGFFPKQFKLYYRFVLVRETVAIYRAYVWQQQRTDGEDEHNFCWWYEWLQIVLRCTFLVRWCQSAKKWRIEKNDSNVSIWCFACCSSSRFASSMCQRIRATRFYCPKGEFVHRDAILRGKCILCSL